jgi:putative flippase GtrA
MFNYHNAKKPRLKTKTNKKTKPELARIAEYFIGGGAWFWSGYVIIVWLKDIIPLFYANFIGQTVGMTINYIVQRYWAFDTNKKGGQNQATQRYVIYTVANVYGLNYLILQYLRNVGIEPEFSQFIAGALFTPWNYYWYKKWVFKDR